MNLKQTKIPKFTPPKPQANQHNKYLPFFCTMSTYLAGIWDEALYTWKNGNLY